MEAEMQTAGPKTKQKQICHLQEIEKINNVYVTYC